MEKNIIQKLIDVGIITKKDIDEYNKQNATGLIQQQAEAYYKTNIKSQKAQKPIYSVIKDGVLVKFDERDLDKNGGYVTPKGVVEIGDSAFENCRVLRKVHLSRDVIKIGVAAFRDCRELDTVTMTNSVLKIGSRAFDSCFSLRKLELSKNIDDIKEFTFKSCLSLKEIILPEKVQTIGFYAFGNCENLKVITTITSKPENLLWIHSDAFEGTPIGDDFMRKFKEIQKAQKQEKGNTK